MAEGGRSRQRVLVAGASGVIGRAALDAFARAPGWEALGVSRRPPHLAEGGWIHLDLLDREACAAALGRERITHLVFCALQERPGLVAGWFDRALMETNRRMLENVLDALAPQAALEHVSLLQGEKAYGAHVHPMRIPAREREPRDPHENFYWLQEDLLRERARRAGFRFTLWRPPVVFGHALGAPMNPLAAIASFAAIARAEGRPLAWPGGVSGAIDAVDARLLARAFVWAATAPAARDEVFNVGNGDVFVWENLFRAAADALGMELGEPRPERLAESMPPRAGLWARLVATHRLRAPGLLEWVGDSFAYADLLFHPGREAMPPPVLMSTIKLRRAGFHDCVDSEDMLVGWLEWLEAQRMIPPRD